MSCKYYAICMYLYISTFILYTIFMTQSEALLELLETEKVIRPRDLANHGISRITLYALQRQGKIEQSGRGLYMRVDQAWSLHHSLAEASKRVPHGIVCLISALSFHELGTQLPNAVWMAVDVHARKPNVDYPPLQIVRFSGEALGYGVEVKEIEGVAVPITSLAKTVADCFKYRNKIGLDVALEALRECRRGRRCTMDELWSAAAVCRMQNVMKPYLEAIW